GDRVHAANRLIALAGDRPAPPLREDERRASRARGGPAPAPAAEGRARGGAGALRHTVAVRGPAGTASLEELRRHQLDRPLGPGGRWPEHLVHRAAVERGVADASAR